MMETYIFLSQDKKTIKEFWFNPSDLAKVEKLLGWLEGFMAAKSGRIEGHFELVMLLRQITQQYSEQEVKE